MGAFNFGLLGQFETILPDEVPLPPEEYLKGVSREDLLRVGTSLIRHNPHSSPFRKWQDLLRMWFRPGNEAFLTYVWHNSQELSKEHGTPISFLYPPAGLKFFEFAYNMPEPEVVLDSLQSEINLFKAYLYFISEATKEETVDENYIKQIPTAHRPALILLHQQFPYSEFVNVNVYDVFICQMIKAHQLFEFFESKPEVHSLLQAFYKEFGLEHWKDYFRYIMPLVVAETQKMDASWTDIPVPVNENYDKNCHFLDSLSLKNLDEELNVDFKLMRGSPLYKKSPGLYSTTYPLFLIEKIFKGLFFHFKVLYDAMPEKTIASWNTFYTKDFAESYLLYNVFDYIYEKRSYIRFSGDQMDAQLKKKGGIDYYIRNGKDIMLFESKSVFINANIKQAGDLEELQKALHSKFYFDFNEQGKMKPKAVRQLVRNVARVLRKENSFDKNYKENRVNIYPVIVVHDSTFNTPALNYLIDLWFSEELDTLRNEGLDVSRVKPSSIINIDSLILYADYLKLKKMTLVELLDGYIKGRTFNEKKQYRDAEHLKASYGKTLLPFTSFIDEITDVGFKKVPHVYWNNMIKKHVPD